MRRSRGLLWSLAARRTGSATRIPRFCKCLLENISASGEPIATVRSTSTSIVIWKWFRNLTLPDSAPTMNLFLYVEHTLAYRPLDSDSCAGRVCGRYIVCELSVRGADQSRSAVESLR